MRQYKQLQEQGDVQPEMREGVRLRRLLETYGHNLQMLGASESRKWGVASSTSSLWVVDRGWV